MLAGPKRKNFPSSSNTNFSAVKSREKCAFPLYKSLVPLQQGLTITAYNETVFDFRRKQLLGHAKGTKLTNRQMYDKNNITVELEYDM